MGRWDADLVGYQWCFEPEVGGREGVVRVRLLPEWCQQSSCMLARRGGFSGLSHASFVCDVLSPPGRLIETNLMFLKTRLVVVGAPGMWTPVFGTAPALLVGGAMVGLQAPEM